MSTDTPASAPADSAAERYLAVQRSDEFAGLRRALRGFVFPMTVAFFLWYALYVILSAYARDFMGTKLFGSNINVALFFSLADPQDNLSRLPPHRTWRQLDAYFR